MSEIATFRILDAGFNRASEGLRVVEDYVRFALDDAHLTGLVKHLRHDLASLAASMPAIARHASRDTAHDVGTDLSTPSESRRPDAWTVCAASLERVKQSLRSLEEFSKVDDPACGAEMEALRYRFYAIESALGRTVDAIARLESVRLCVLVDGRGSEAEFVTLAGELIAAGVGMIQLRDKQLPVRELVERARLLAAMARRSQPIVSPPSSPLTPDGTARQRSRESNVPAWRPLVIINDRPAVAAVVDADGVHLGQDDFAVKDARAVVGSARLIGVSTHTLAQARQAVLDGANYIGVGPTFPSTTKEFDRFPGLGLLRDTSAEIRLPAFAIGGVAAANIAEVVAAGASRVAVSGAVTGSPSPAGAVRDLLAALESSAVETARPAEV